MFVNTPNALEGNNTDKCDTAAADFQSKETGVIDGVGTEAVSYTHLDVYKRQALHPLWTISDKTSFYTLQDRIC